MGGRLFNAPRGDCLLVSRNSESVDVGCTRCLTPSPWCVEESSLPRLRSTGAACDREKRKARVACPDTLLPEKRANEKMARSVRVYVYLYIGIFVWIT